MAKDEINNTGRIEANTSVSAMRSIFENRSQQVQNKVVADPGKVRRVNEMLRSRSFIGLPVVPSVTASGRLLPAAPIVPSALRNTVAVTGNVAVEQNPKQVEQQNTEQREQAGTTTTAVSTHEDSLEEGIQLSCQNLLEESIEEIKRLEYLPRKIREKLEEYIGAEYLKIKNGEEYDISEVKFVKKLQREREQSQGRCNGI